MINSARFLAAVASAGLMLTACGQRVRSDGSGSVQANPSGSAKSNGQSWQAQYEQDRAHLEGYGWVNKAAGVVHIPIEHAMDLIVAEKQSSGPANDRAPIPEYRDTNNAAQNEGRQRFVQYGCSICHDSDSPSHAPSLRGIFGRRVRLDDGTFVVADDQYLRDSILHSRKQVVAGYGPFMPDYSSVIAEPDVLELIAYLKSTSPATPANPTLSLFPLSGSTFSSHLLNR